MADAMGGAGAPEVTIVIVSYNTSDLLERCLEAAFASAPGVSREVPVIDNASSDGSAEWVAGRWPDVLLTVNRANRGYVPACNQGLQAARGRFVLALNSDAFLRGEALGVLTRHLKAHAEARAVGQRLLNADGSTQWVCARRAPRFLPSLLAHTHLPAWFPGLLPFARGAYPPAWYESAGEVEVLSGACTLFRREALDRAGLLDERLVLDYDDAEWSLRARGRGLRLHYRSKAEVMHLGGMSRDFDAELSSLANLSSIGTFWDLAFVPSAAAVLKLALLVSIGLSLLKNALLGPFAARRRARAAPLVRMLKHGLAMLLRPAAARPGRSPA